MAKQSKREKRNYSVLKNLVKEIPEKISGQRNSKRKFLVKGGHSKPYHPIFHDRSIPCKKCDSHIYFYQMASTIVTNDQSIIFYEVIHTHLDTRRTLSVKKSMH